MLRRLMIFLAIMAASTILPYLVGMGVMYTLRRWGGIFIIESSEGALEIWAVGILGAFILTFIICIIYKVGKWIITGKY